MILFVILWYRKVDYMQIKLSKTKCRQVIGEMKKAEINLRQQLNELDIIIIELKRKNTKEDYAIKRHIEKQRNLLWEECQKICVLYKSLEKILELYFNTDERLSDSVSMVARKRDINIRINRIVYNDIRVVSLKDENNLIGNLFNTEN